MTNTRRAARHLHAPELFPNGTGTIPCVAPESDDVQVAKAISPWLLDNAFLRTLDSKQVRGLCEVGVLQKFASGEMVVGPGEILGSLFLVVDGLVESRSWSRSPGEIFGEFAIVSGSPTRDSVYARSAVTVATFPVAVVRRLLGCGAPLPAPVSPALARQVAIDALRLSGFFEPLTDEELATLARSCELRSFARGEEIETVGGGISFYLLLSGQLTWSDCHLCDERLVGELIEGVAFRVSGAPSSGCIRARSSGWLLQLSRKALTQLSQVHPDAGAHFGQYL